MPILAGIVAAPALAIFWHVVIGTVVGMVRLTMIVALFVVAVIVTVISLGASAQAIATAVAGRAALSAELSAVVDGYNQKLAKAYAEATGWSGIATSAGAKAAGYATQAETEVGWFERLRQGLRPALRLAARHRGGVSPPASRRSTDCLRTQPTSVRRATPIWRTARRRRSCRPERLHGRSRRRPAAIAKLNAIDPRPIIVNTGAVVVSKKGIDLTKETADFQATANKALANRQTGRAPIFTPMSVGEATRKQILGAAMHGWILASAIDLLPLFFLILAFVLSREVWLNEEVIREKLTHEGQGRHGPQKAGQPHGPRRVVPFRASGRMRAHALLTAALLALPFAADGASHRARPNAHARGCPHHGRLRRVQPWHRPATPHEP